MGKFGPRLDSKKNAKRWPKGQSSSSNPETKKFRDEATSMFFKETTGKPGITKEDLQRHDAIQGIEPELENLDLEDANTEILCADGTADTYDTFASAYSNCTNISFTRFLNHFESNSALHKEMLAMLATVAEIIKQNGGHETSTEYFAALMSTLDAVESETSIAATLSLLGMGIKTVPKSVLNVHFGSASKILLDILTEHATSDNFLILRHCIHCLSLLLRAQETATWSNSSTMQALGAILSFITHSKPKVRKAAQHGICAMMKGSDIMKSSNPPQYHPAAPQIAKSCIGQLDLNSEPGGITNVLHVLTLLKDILHLLPRAHVKTICETLLNFMTLKNVLVTSCCFQTFHGLFVSRPLPSILPAQRNAQIITALYDFQPPATDTQPTLAWLTVMQEAHLNLSQHAQNLCAAVLPKLLEKCMELWLSDRTEIIAGTSHAIKILLEDCVGKMCATEEDMQRYSNTINQIAFMMHQSLKYQYLEAWYHVFHLVALLFKIAGQSKCSNFTCLLKSLAELRDSFNFASKSDVEYAIGAAIRYMGPELVLHIIPLNILDDTINLKRTWLLPLLKDCITKGSLQFFLSGLLPFASQCEEKARAGGIASKTYELLVSQVWSILPSICHNAIDVKDNFKRIAKLMGMKFTENKDLRLSIMSALRRLILRAIENDNEEEIMELSRYAKNYIPIFLQLYTTDPLGTDENGQRLAALDTIKVYLKISNPELVNELFDRALPKLSDPEVSDFFKDSVHDIIRLLVEYTDTDRLKQLFDICATAITAGTKEQKKGYRFLEDICGSDKPTCRTFVEQRRREIQTMLLSSVTQVVKPSRKARLRCMIYLVQIHPQLEQTKFLKAIVPEAVVYLKDLNSKCRETAYELLKTIANKFLNNPNHLNDYIKMLLAGLGTSESYCALSMTALAALTNDFNGVISVDMIKEIFEQACILALSPTKDVADAAISFIKSYTDTMPSPIVATNLTKIMDILCKLNRDVQKFTRKPMRLILRKLYRTFGFEALDSLIPPGHYLHKKLKNLHTFEQKQKMEKLEKQKVKQQHEPDENEFNAKRRPKSIEDILADSDEEFETVEKEEPKKNKKRTSRKEAWIQENEEIVDLVDPAAARNISTTQPGVSNPNIPVRKAKDHGFKTAPDGRLIITEDKEKDEEQVSKKRKQPFLHSDSDEGSESEDSESVPVLRPLGKKRTLSDDFEAISLKSSPVQKYKAGGSGIHRPLKKRRIEQAPGAEYKARKAKGDIKKKGKPDPYAYIPMSRANISKRRKLTKIKKKLKKIFKNTNKNVVAQNRN